MSYDNLRVPGREELKMTGDFIDTDFALEPGAAYGMNEDSVAIKSGTRNATGVIIFSSGAELREFAKQLNRYLEMNPDIK
ncbi:MAG: hypothetical protein K2M59_09905 [Muribaculaceae bacterium]|nr:hypothetical protein [Muribaculaceae bacterium]